MCRTFAFAMLGGGGTPLRCDRLGRFIAHLFYALKNYFAVAVSRRIFSISNSF